MVTPSTRGISNISNISSRGVCLGYESACMASAYYSILSTISIPTSKPVSSIPKLRQPHHHYRHYHRHHAIGRVLPASRGVARYRHHHQQYQQHHQRLVSVGRRSPRSLTNCQALNFIPRTTPVTPANPGSQNSQLPARRQWTPRCVPLCVPPCVYPCVRPHPLLPFTAFDAPSTSSTFAAHPGSSGFLTTGVRKYPGIYLPFSRLLMLSRCF